MMLLGFRCSSLQRMHVAMESGKGWVDPFSPGTPPGPTVFMAMYEAAAAARGLTSLTLFMPGGLRPLAPGAPPSPPTGGRGVSRFFGVWHHALQRYPESGVGRLPSKSAKPQPEGLDPGGRAIRWPQKCTSRCQRPVRGERPSPAAESIRKTLESERMPPAMPRRHCPPACSRDVAWLVRP